MNIGAFERATGLPRTTIRFYEAQGLLQPAESGSGNGYRVYDAGHVERARLIKVAQALGFSIAEIARLTRSFEADRLSEEEKKQVLREKLGEVEDKLASLTAMRRYIRAKLEWLEAGSHGSPPDLGTGPAARPSRRRGSLGHETPPRLTGHTA
jgi:DNA-binding transcriptional MerR regulator